MSLTQVDEARREMHPAPHYPHREKRAAKPKSGNGIGSLGALYVNALAIAQEAIDRYREFSVHAADRGNDAIADLFGRLAELEAEHAFRLAEVAEGMASPKVPAGDYAWLNSGTLLPEARDFIFRMMTPRHALEIAMRAERRARAFFEQVRVASNDPRVRELAIEFGRDEDSHLAWLQDALARVPEPFLPSEDSPGDPAAPQAL